ncbi:MAG: glycosyltransferase, partial [Agathobaculum sp.]
MNKIPVLYLSSEAYSKILAVSMLSLLDNKEDNTFYEIYVLVEKKYSEQSLKPFRFMEEKYDGFSLHWIEMEDAFSDTKVNVAGVGKETMYRLMAPKMLAGIDRCIYLDSDTLILSDLEEMFEHDIQDNYFSGVYPERFLSN